MSAIIWTDREGVGQALEWISGRLGLAFPTIKRHQSSVSSVSNSPNFYAAVFSAPLSRRSDYRKAVELALPQLMPIAISDLLIYARHGRQGVELAGFRRDDLKLWETAERGGRRGRVLPIGEGWRVLPPADAKIATYRQLSVLCAAAVSIAALVAGYFGYRSDQANRLEGLLAEERKVRAAAVELGRIREEADLWSTLRNAHLEDRLPASVVAAIAELSRLTPDTATWSRLDWSPIHATIAGAASDPVAVLSSVSAIPTASSVAFSKPIVASSAARQEFEILVTYRSGDQR